MKRRAFITLLGGVAAAWPLGAGAQQTMPLVGFMNINTSAESVPDLVAAFRQGLRETGASRGGPLLSVRPAAPPDREDEIKLLPASTGPVVADFRR